MTGLYELPELYDAQYDTYRDDLHFYRSLARDHGDSVLELGAGTGRVSAALAAEGLRVAAVDISEPMLDRARIRLQAEGLAERVELHLDDMRSLDLGRRFPLVVAPFNTLMHAITVQDQDATLAAVRRHLEPGGAFAFDLFLPHFGPQGVLRRERIWEGLAGAGSELFLVQHHDPLQQTIESIYYLDQVDDEGRLTRRSAKLLQRYFTRFELMRALRQTDFEQVRLFGGFQKGPLTGDATIMVGIASGQHGVGAD